MQPNENSPPHPNRVLGGPRYPSRATRLSSEVQDEFGVSTAHELVSVLNSAWAKCGRRALAYGSFPTTQALLRGVVRELRLARGEGLLDD